MSNVFVETWNYKTYYIIVNDIQFAIPGKATDFKEILVNCRLMKNVASDFRHSRSSSQGLDMLLMQEAKLLLTVCSSQCEECTVQRNFASCIK